MSDMVLNNPAAGALSLRGVITTGATLIGSLALPVGYRTYSGTYEVVPATHEQELYTAGKKLDKNVTVHEIPSYEVSNTAGGDTFVIGKEL